MYVHFLNVFYSSGSMFDPVMFPCALPLVIFNFFDNLPIQSVQPVCI